MRFLLGVLVNETVSVANSKGSGRVRVLANLGRDLDRAMYVYEVRILVRVSNCGRRISFRVLNCLYVQLCSGLMFVFFNLIARAIFRRLLCFSCAVMAFSPAAIVSAVVVISKAEGNDLVGIQVDTSDDHDRGSTAKVSMSAGFLAIGGQITLDRLLGDVLVVFRQVVARVTMAMAIVYLSARQDVSPVTCDSCGGTGLHRANAVTVVRHGIDEGRPRM